MFSKNERNSRKDVHCRYEHGVYAAILYGDEEGNNLITKTISGKASEAREIGLQLAKLISKEYERYEG